MIDENIYEEFKKLFLSYPYIKIQKSKNSISFSVEFSPEMHKYISMYLTHKKTYTHTIFFHPDKSYTRIDTIDKENVSFLDRIKKQHIGNLDLEGYRYINHEEPLAPIRWSNKDMKETISNYLAKTKYRNRSKDWELSLNNILRSKEK